MRSDFQRQDVRAIDRAYEVVWRMANAGGCAWHEVQTHESLTKYLIEETYELVDAIEQAQQGEHDEDVPIELGDVLYQVLFHAVIAERDGEGYSLDSVAEALAEKLIARHPHVFSDRGHMSVEELNAEWEHLKEEAAGSERGTRGALDGIPTSLPPLARAAKVVERLKRARLHEPSGEKFDEQQLGDALLRLVERANAHGLDPDRALRVATERLASTSMEE